MSIGPGRGTDSNEFGKPTQISLGGFQFELTSPLAHGILATATTDAYGDFVFDDLKPGKYTVFYNQSSIPFTTSNTFTVTIGSGGSAKISFGYANTA